MYCAEMKFIAYFTGTAWQREISLADVKYHKTTLPYCWMKWKPQNWTMN